MYKYDEDGDFYTESGSVASPEGVEREFLDCDDILEKLNKLEACERKLSEMQQKFFTLEKQDVVFIEGYEKFFQVSEVNELENTVDLGHWSEDLENFNIDNIEAVFKKLPR